MSTKDLERVDSLSTCEVSDVLIKLGFPHGGLITDLTMFSGRGTISGPVFTVKMVSSTDQDAPKPTQHFVDACPEGCVLLLQTPIGTKSGCWGGLMSTAAKTKGIKGVVIDGGCRDLSEHRALGYPVFARHHSTLGPATFTRPSAFAQAITVDPLPPLSEPPFPSITVQSGDILLCDEDGCVAIPVEIVTEVVEKALAAREIDDNVRRDLLQGKGVQESMQRWRGKV